MKKKFFMGLGLSAIIAASVAVGAYAASDIKLFINGKVVSSGVEIIDGSSYVPLRVVSEALGADVKWDGDKREIQIQGKGYDPAQANVPPAKSFNVNVNITSGPMTLDITKVTLDPAYKENKYSNPVKAIILDSIVENTSNDSVNWYITQDKIVTNTKEQVSGYLHSEQVDGEFLGKVVKKGKIVFEIKGDLSAISSFNYNISGPIGKDYKRIGEAKTTEIILK